MHSAALPLLASRSLRTIQSCVISVLAPCTRTCTHARTRTHTRTRTFASSPCNQLLLQHNRTLFNAKQLDEPTDVTAASTAAPSLDDGLGPLLASNRDWASTTRAADPVFFDKLAAGQAPNVFWIGCCDSRVPETTILGRRPGEVFVYRNIANICNSTDLSLLSALEYAVVYIKVKHIIICGHTGCGGVAAALDSKKLGKIDTWLVPLRELRLRHAEELKALQGKDKGRALVELNVRHGVEVLRRNADVIEAKASRGLKIHGLVFDLESGELKNLDLDEETSDSAELRKGAFAIS